MSKADMKYVQPSHERRIERIENILVNDPMKMIRTCVLWCFLFLTLNVLVCFVCIKGLNKITEIFNQIQQKEVQPNATSKDQKKST